MAKEETPHLQINLFGSFQVKVGDEMAEFRTDALRVLLAYLAVHQGVPQRRDTLAGVLSPDRPDKEALTYLRNRLTRLRRALKDEQADPAWLVVDRKQILLRAGDDIVVDAMRFDLLLAQIAKHTHRQLAGCPACMAMLQEVVGLVRGEFLAGLNFPSEQWESWLLAQREHYQQQALAGMGQLCEARMVLGEWTAVCDLAQRQLILEPWLEEAHRALMTAHYQLGDRNAALAQYERCLHVLDEELGVPPEPETVQLYEQILADEVIWGETAVRHNLPLQTGLFFGRENEQNQLLKRLVDPAYRLMTLVGTGGMGKTRLSVEVGQQVKQSFPDGVWFVSLEAMTGGAEQIKIGVGEAMGLGQAGKQLSGEHVLNILRDKQMLLILDNCETVLDELAFIPNWLGRAPHLAILATSREPLNFQAESVVLLEGLPTSSLSGNLGFRNLGFLSKGPDFMGELALSPAEALFVERAQMTRDGFVVSADNLAQVHQICELVDGSPLGIALAASWVRRRSLEQIVESIGRSLDFLSTRLRDIDPRHRSMRAVFETSWQLLSVEEQAVLAALAVFPATFTAEAAEEIANASLFVLDTLCEKSLLQQQYEPERYHLHSLVRQFALEKLADDAVIFDQAFVDYFYTWVDMHQTDYEQLQPEWGNLLASIHKAHHLERWSSVLELVNVLDEPWFRQIRFTEMREGLTLALSAATVLQAQPALANIHLRLAEIETELNEYEMAEAHLAESMHQLMRLEDSLGIAQATYLSGRIKNEQGQDEQALQFFARSKRIFAEEEDWLWVARTLNLTAVCHARKYRDFQTAKINLQESVQLQKQFPLSSTYIETLRNLARITGWLQAYDEADSYLVEAVAASQQLNDLGEYAAVMYERLLLCKKQEQFDTALTFAYVCLDSFRQLGSLRWEALIKTQIGIIYRAKQCPSESIPFFEEGLEIFCELGDAYEQAYSHYYLYQSYADIGELEKSLSAKQQANKLNNQLQDPQLQKWLA